MDRGSAKAGSKTQSRATPNSIACAVRIRAQQSVDPIDFAFDDANPKEELARYGSVVNSLSEVVYLMFRFRKTLLAAIVAATITFSAATMLAQKDPEVGGAAMYPTKNIVENAVNSQDHTTLVAAVKAAGLVDTLEGAGPFTVFAPTNEAFAKLPAGTVDTLLKPENKNQLAKILTYHVVAGKVSSKALVGMIKKSGGKTQLKTVSGGMLIASLQGGKVILTDEKGGTAVVTIADVYQSNGVIHVVDSVLLPN
jgi:uncharacterized surface protein with fasciclin (FAS1) repeats